ncbi:protein spaetzle-like [Coccinella septempunctata]|uniref:protein spaetzle-like n=1 Tax=Coccinella septempunctata TaxID=41139 RepID=UPI001D077000|nr:protein spaetzle-like [Coccinella septempunctata]
MMKDVVVSVLIVLATLLMVCQAKRSTPSRILRKRSFKPKDVDEDCKGIECTSPSRYPERQINKLARRLRIESFGKVFEPTKMFDIKLRSPFDEEDDEGENVCAFREVTIFPKTAKDEDYKLRFIVNTKEHQQGITYQLCTSKESFINRMLLGYYFFCKQNYSTVRLLYLTEDGQLEYGKFPVPSACVCSYKKKI